MFGNLETKYLNNDETGYHFISRLFTCSKNRLYYANHNLKKKSSNENEIKFVIKSYRYETIKEIADVKREINIMEILKKYDCFIKYEDQFDSTFLNAKYRFMVMKYYEHSDLFNYTFSNPKFNGLQHQEVCQIVYQILQILKILKEKRIVHHDIKLENILIISKSPLKIIFTDFEYAEQLEINQKAKICDATLYIRAPEILKNQLHDMSSDMWSVGIITFQLLFGYNPFLIDLQCECPKALLDMIENNEIFDDEINLIGIPNEAIECVLSMLKIDPSERITVEEALELDWFKGMNNVENNHLFETIKRANQEIYS